MIAWNVTLDEHDNAIMTRMTTPHLEEEDVLYLDPWMLELERSLREEDQRMEEMERGWDSGTDDE